MSGPVAAVLLGALAVLAGLFLLVALLAGPGFGLAAVLLAGGTGAVVAGLLIDTGNR